LQGKPENLYRMAWITRGRMEEEWHRTNRRS